MTKGRVALVLVAILAALIAGGYWFVAIPDTEVPNGKVSQTRFTAGPYTVVSEKFELVDPSHTVPSGSDGNETQARTLGGEIWRPKGRKGAGPLVVYSHGFLSFRQEGLYLTRFLVSHGYTVAAVDFPRTSIYAFDNPDMADVANQPRDVSLVIDALLERNADPADALHQTIDTSRIALAGVSLGGLTSILATFHPDLKDPRVAALVSVAGPASMFTARFYAGSQVPALLVYGDADLMVPLRDNGRPFFAAYPNSTLVVLKKASHTAFAQPAATLNRFAANPDAQGCEVVSDKLQLKGFTELGDELGDMIGGPEWGIEWNPDLNFCVDPPVPQAMKASRQHMFTTLAVHAFLESQFADDPAAREDARNYLLRTLPEENGQDLTVTAHPGQPPRK